MRHLLSAFRRGSSSGGVGSVGMGSGGGASPAGSGSGNIDPTSSQLGTVRIAVIGPPSCGKSALVALLCRAAAASGAGPSRQSAAAAAAAAATSAAAAAAAASAAANSASSALCAVTVALADVPVFGLDDETCCKKGGDAADPEAAATAAVPRRSFFVEIFDVSGQPSHCELRRLFYSGLNGVVLAYDLSSCPAAAPTPDGGTIPDASGAAAAAIMRQVLPWAAEVAAEGSFVAPLSPAVAERGGGVGGLLVPVLLAGCKLDRQRRRRRRWGAGAGGGPGGGAAGGWLFSALRALLARLLLLLTLPLVWRRRRAAGAQSGGGLLPVTTGGRGSSSNPAAAGPPPPHETAAAGSLHSGGGGHGGGGPVTWTIATSAATGEVETRDALSAFLALLWARRYAPSSLAARLAEDAAAAKTPPSAQQQLPPPPPAAASAYDPYAPAPAYTPGGWAQQPG
jgi:GTPase SAR1 family protein